MKLVTPAILPKNFLELTEHIERVRGHAEVVQIDACDGNFVDALTWPYDAVGPTLESMMRDGKVLPYVDEFHIEIDLMVSRPERVIGHWIEVGATRIIVHIASTDHMDDIISMLTQKYGYAKGFAPDLLSLGIAVPVGMKLSAYEQYVDQVDFVQFMGVVNIGHQGQPFDSRVPDSIKRFRKAFPDTWIQVDGGVNLETAPAILDAGADTLVIGSALFGRDDIGRAVREFEKLSEQYGTYE